MSNSDSLERQANPWLVYAGIAPVPSDLLEATGRLPSSADSETRNTICYKLRMAATGKVGRPPATKERKAKDVRKVKEKVKEKVKVKVKEKVKVRTKTRVSNIGTNRLRAKIELIKEMMS